MTTASPTTQEQRTPAVASSDLFGVIYCDPPWKFKNYNDETATHWVGDHYPLMETEEICALQVPAAKDCVLYLWATAPMMEHAMQVITAWGFKYKSQAVWDKQRSGIGHWFLGQHELLLVATRGKKSPPPPDKRTSSLLSYPRGKHSAKPDQVRDLIAKWYPGDRKLEMFARPYTGFWPKHDGWETWGNELTNDVAMTPNI